MIHSYSWSQLYAAAVLETDQSKMSDRILEAGRAIRSRSSAMEIDSDEIKFMGIALASLRNLWGERVDRPVLDIAPVTASLKKSAGVGS